jgi:hypothetical protein
MNTNGKETCQRVRRKGKGRNAGGMYRILLWQVTVVNRLGTCTRLEPKLKDRALLLLAKATESPVAVWLEPRDTLKSRLLRLSPVVLVLQFRHST